MCARNLLRKLPPRFANVQNGSNFYLYYTLLSIL